MNARLVAEASDLLIQASRHLHVGNLTIAEQVALAAKCLSSAYRLRAELEKVSVQVEA